LEIIFNILYEGIAYLAIPSFFERISGLNDPQQSQNNENDHNHKQRMDDIAASWKARDDTRSKKSEQP
jgi:hypothetical protein